jgi:hypothetical protein
MEAGIDAYPKIPLLKQIQDKANQLSIPTELKRMMKDPTIQFAFLDTENDAPLKGSPDKRWTASYCNELSIWVQSSQEWIHLDFNMDEMKRENTEWRLQQMFDLFQTTFENPHTFVIYNSTEKTIILDLYKHFKTPCPHSFYDLYNNLMKELVQDKDQNSPNKLYCHLTKLTVLMKYWYEGTQESIPREIPLKTTPDNRRKSQLDVCYTFAIWDAINKYVVQ